MLAGLLHSLEKETAPPVTFLSERCLRKRLNKNECTRCVDVCRSKAIEREGRTIVYREDRCTGCMGCFSVCPNDAFACEFNMFDLLPPLQRSNSERPLTISCRRAAPCAENIRIPCLGLLSEPVLAAMHCVAAADFYLDVGPCADCENGAVLDRLHSRMRGLATRLGGSERPRIRYCTGGFPEKANRASARRFFLGMAGSSLLDAGKESVRLMADAPEADPQDASRERRPVQLSRFLHKALDMVPQEEDARRDLLKSYFRTIKIKKEQCDQCPLCSGMCPTGALKRKNGDGEKRLLFTSAGCSGCGLCVEFCRKQAVLLQPGCHGDPGEEMVVF
ncbi:MAG: 4Fe-4S dicluster domain-containing protein [Desulfobulbaceae bacterium]